MAYFIIVLLVFSLFCPPLAPFLWGLAAFLFVLSKSWSSPEVQVRAHVRNGLDWDAIIAQARANPVPGERLGAPGHTYGLAPLDLSSVHLLTCADNFAEILESEAALHGGFLVNVQTGNEQTQLFFGIEL